MPARPATPRSDAPRRLLAGLMLACAALACAACSSKPTLTPGEVVTADYGQLPDGRTAHIYVLTNTNGLTAKVTDFGATLVSLSTPDRDGNFKDICMGYTELDGWVNDGSYMGASVGRYGNRIANARFTLDGETYELAANNGPNHLHGGAVGFNKKLWTAQTIEREDGSGVRFIYVSPDGEEGYPGELTCVVTYFLNNSDELIVEFEATTDAPTVVNLVHHTYWNLTGDPNQTILDHELLLSADGYVPTDATNIPNAGVQPVEGTPFDFRTMTRIGERIDGDHEQLGYGGGYDHSWAVNGDAGTLRPAAAVYDPGTGRVMTIETDQPAIQFYTANHFDGSQIGKWDLPHNHRTGFCLETQTFPDSPNQRELSNAVLRPGETYTHRMVHRFTTR